MLVLYTQDRIDFNRYLHRCPPPAIPEKMNTRGIAELINMNLMDNYFSLGYMCISYKQTSSKTFSDARDRALLYFSAKV